MPGGRNSALHGVVRTFIHIDVDLPHAPTAAQKESLPEIHGDTVFVVLQILAKALAPHEFEVQGL